MAGSPSGLTASSGVQVHRPVGDVFPWVADPNLASRWQPEVTAHTITRGTAGMVGTEFVETLTGRRGSAEMRGRVVAYRQDELIEFDLQGPGVRVHARYTVEPAPPGTFVRADVVVQPAQRVPSVLAPFIQWRMRRQLRRQLHVLRQLCEAAHAST